MFSKIFYSQEADDTKSDKQQEYEQSTSSLSPAAPPPYSSYNGNDYTSNAVPSSMAHPAPPALQSQSPVLVLDASYASWKAKTIQVTRPPPHPNVSPSAPATTLYTATSHIRKPHLVIDSASAQNLASAIFPMSLRPKISINLPFAAAEPTIVLRAKSSLSKSMTYESPSLALTTAHTHGPSDGAGLLTWRYQTSWTEASLVCETVPSPSDPDMKILGRFLFDKHWRNMKNLGRFEIFWPLATAEGYGDGEMGGGNRALDEIVVVGLAVLQWMIIQRRASAGGAAAANSASAASVAAAVAAT